MEKVKKNINLEKDYWDKFYKDCAIDIPSQFCVSMATDNHNKKTVVEFGMGNGRDSLYLSTQGHIVVAVDISESAVLACNNTMQQKNIDHTTFLCGDISIKGTVANAISTARQNCLFSIYQRITLLNKIETHLDLSLLYLAKNKLINNL